MARYIAKTQYSYFLGLYTYSCTKQSDLKLPVK